MTAVDADRLLELADTDPEAMFELFEQHGWGDGLPLVPPTPERVDAMLERSDGDPDEELAVLPPRSGVVTRRVVAVNAVLAGCPADVFPVVLTAVRALAHPEVNLRGVNATTHPVAPLVIVQGDVVKQCGFNAGIGAFGPGNRANATVGRAVRLMMLHVAGALPGIGRRGDPGPAGEVHVLRGREPRRVPVGVVPASRGVDAPSAVTVHCGEGPHNVHDMEAEGDPALDPRQDRVGDDVARHEQRVHQPGRVLPRPRARARAHASPRHGLARGDIASYLFDHARMPARVFHRHFEERAWAEWMKLAAPDDLLPMTAHPDNIQVFVVGGPGQAQLADPVVGHDEERHPARRAAEEPQR